MAAPSEAVSGIPDGVKWVFVAALSGGAIAAFYLLAEHSLLLRVIGLLVICGIVMAVALQTGKGRSVWSFIQEARTEVRKVVWPTRKETVQTTMIVLGMVVVVSIMLWILDGLLGYGVRLLLGQGG